MKLFNIFRVVREANFREIVRAQIFALIETTREGLWVDMTRTGQAHVPGLPEELANQLCKLVSQNLKLISEAMTTLQLDGENSRAARHALFVVLRPLSPQKRFDVLYQAIVEGIDYDQLRVHTTRAPGHVCRVTTVWQGIENTH